MFHISGPSYRYSGEILDRPEIIYVEDHHHAPEHGYALQRLLDNSSCPVDQHLLVFDHVLIQDEFDSYPHVCLPLLLAAEAEEFNQICEVKPQQSKTHAFNFMINKARPHRFILMDLICEHGLTNYKHSLCWQDAYRGIPSTDYRFGDERTMPQGILNGSHKNAETYQYLLRDRVFDPTCVSLISEPAYMERETIVTEKTLMAIWSYTVPIWVGGWRCADYMSSLGFDVFNDIVDHGYQKLPDPTQRCAESISRNLDLLEQPWDMSALLPRLEHNISLLRSNVFLADLRSKIDRYPELLPLVRGFRHGVLSSSF